MKEEYWTTKDGQKIAVGDMTDEHVRNTLRMIIRKAREMKEHQELIDNIGFDGFGFDEWWK